MLLKSNSSELCSPHARTNICMDNFMHMFTYMHSEREVGRRLLRRNQRMWYLMGVCRTQRTRKDVDRILQHIKDKLCIP